MKRVLCCVAAAALLLTLDMPAAAFIGLPGGPPSLGWSDDGTQEGESIVLEGISYNAYSLKIFPTNSDPADFGLPDTILASHTYGRFVTECEVTWDLSGLDTSFPGWVYITGTLTPPEGYSVKLGLTAEYPVMLTEEGMDPEPVADLYSNDEYLVVGRGEEISDWHARAKDFGCLLEDRFTVITQSGLFFEAPVRWDFSAVDTASAGRYPIGCVIDLPACFSLPPELTPDASFAYVVEPDRIDLSAFRVSGLGYTGDCAWLFTPENAEEITVQYAVDGGPWQTAEAEPMGSGRMLAEEIGCIYTSNTMTIQFGYLENGEYAVRLVYQGVASNVLRFVMDDNVIKDWDIGGDRGGADQGPQKPPDIEQPAPTPDPGDDDEAPPATPPGEPQPQIPQDPQEPIPDPGDDDEAPPVTPPGEPQPQRPSGTEGAGSGERDRSGSSTPDQDVTTEKKPAVTATVSPPLPEAVHVQAEVISQTPMPVERASPQAVRSDVPMEISTEKSLSITGLRLREMLALSGDTVLFEKQGVAVELSADFLSELAVGDESRFEVRIEKGENAFSLEILLDGVPLSDLPPTTVYAPATLTEDMDRENLACFDAQGEEVSAAVYDAAQQVARVEIQATGIYTITARVAMVTPVSAPLTNSSADGAPTTDNSGNSVNSAVFLIVGVGTVILCAAVLLLRRWWMARTGGNG